MLFNSYVFWAFFAVVLTLHAVLRGRARKALLLVASYVFYGYWDWRFLGLIALSTLTDFFAAQVIDRSADRAHKKAWLAASVALNLGILGFFKYFDFFVESLSSVLVAAGMPGLEPVLNVVLPVGISFYTFQTMSYTIDVYRGQLKPTRDLLDFALFVSFFPQLVAGPIERATRFLPQIVSPRQRTAADLPEGAYLVLSGLFRKVVIADNLAAVANAIFSADPGTLTGPEVVVGVYAFAFQIYGDFSGYTDIARGVARWLGYDLMVNFRMPYLSVSPSDFWRRWHISLSSWLRDYLYIPLGGNRHGTFNTYRNLMLTMLLGGLWHGAAWTFVAWGAFHGLILVAYRMVAGKEREVERPLLARVPAMVLMFQLVAVSWLLFRAGSIGQAFTMGVRALSDLTLTPLAVGGFFTVAFFALPLMLYEVWVERSGDLMAVLRRPWPARAVLAAFAVLMLIFFPAPVQYEFIYFQF
jgi:alginate O-acetyltransferase complex protein AlgI